MWLGNSPLTEFAFLFVLMMIGSLFPDITMPTQNHGVRKQANSRLLLVCPEWVFGSRLGFYEKGWRGGAGETKSVTRSLSMDAFGGVFRAWPLHCDP